jgi:hypothetical protein
VRRARNPDGRPGLRWIAIEGCRCRGFFVEAPLDGRLPHLGAGRRADLGATVQRARIAGREAWITTTDRTAAGLLVVRSERPDRPA